MSKTSKVATQRRLYVNRRFAEETRGKKLTRAQQRGMLNRLWKEAKRKYPMN